MIKRRFVTNTPSHRNATDLFADRWASDLSELAPGLKAGGLPGFRADPRPGQAAAHLGVDGRLDGYGVLELGPLEGAHTCQLEALGAERITAVESNSEAFLKSLIVKNIAGLNRSTFLLGDVSRHLEAPGPRYDLIFYCGILYHMLDPLELIRLAAARTDRIFIWTHDFREERRSRRHTSHVVEHEGLRLSLHEFAYNDRGPATFWGRNRDRTRWMELPDLIRVLAHHGLSETTIIADDPNFVNGPAVTVAAQRPGATPPA